MLAPTSWVVPLVVAAAAVTTACALQAQRLAAADAQAKQQQIDELAQQLAKQKQLRAQERSGRTTAERELREAIQQQQEQRGYAFKAVAHVESCFVDRRGTPRQGSLVPDARATLQFRTSVPPAALEGLEQFSHVWVLFVFHENTNAAKAATGKSTYPAKIAPPRLGGKKVGLFSTRTPHRPNSIGLTVVKVDAVRGRALDISGHDLVNGTPVLDIKPFVPADCIPGPTFPQWVTTTSDAVKRRVEFSSQAQETLTWAVKNRRVRFYTTVQTLMAAIEQMLVLDIRSVHQGRGRATDDTQVFHCRFDKLQIQFQTLEDRIHVNQCSPYCPSNDQDGEDDDAADAPNAYAAADEDDA